MSTPCLVVVGIALGLLAGLGLSGVSDVSTVDYDYLRAAPKPTYNPTLDQPVGYGRIMPVGPGMVGTVGE